jgi:anti-sigma B factor antagonist
MPGQSAYRWLEIDHVGGVTVVRVVGHAIIEEPVIRTIGEELYRLVDVNGYRQLLLDFTEVKSLSSRMLAILVELNKKVKAAEGRLALCGIDPQIIQVFQVTRLDKVLHIYPDENTAILTFGGKSDRGSSRR